MPSSRRKKQRLTRNGVQTLTIRTRHGRFTLVRPRLKDRKGEEARLPCPTLSEPLRRQALFWANRLCFGDVAHLVEEMAGCRLLSEDTVWRLVQRQASTLDAIQMQAIRASAELPEPEYSAPADLYAPENVEFVVMTDGIGVKAGYPLAGDAHPREGR